ncbi:MAG TPA: hypothetical protein VJM33_09255 [Microthrixaceae bacterium]|nr:hypothetical protein [Microthrixaceae bacterium]
MLRYRFGTLMALAATFVLPLYAIPAAFNFAQIATTTDGVGDPGRPWIGVTELSGASDSGDPLLTWIAVVGSSLGIALVGVSVGHLCAQWLMGADPRYGDVLRATVRRLPVLVVAWALVLPLKALGAAVCFVGVVFPIAAFSVLSPVIAAEGVGPIASIARSWRLTTRRLFPMIVLVVIGAVVSGAVSTLLSIAAGILLSVWETAWWVWIAVAAVNILVELLLAPVVAGWASLAYLDLRVRTEGLDLELESVDLFAPAAVGNAQ